MKRVFLQICVIALILSKSLAAQEINQFQNILDIKAYPEKKSKTTGLFSDQGAWFGFCLLPDTTNIVGFGGPWVLSEKIWTSLSLVQFDVKIDNPNNSAKFKKLEQRYLPGRLEADYLSSSLSLNLSLIYDDNGIAFQVAKIKNISQTTIQYKTDWFGSAWQKIRKKNNDQISLIYKGGRILSVFQKQVGSNLAIDTLNRNYRFTSAQMESLRPGEESTSWIAVGLSFTDAELIQIEKNLPKNIAGVLFQVDASKNRWREYLSSLLLNKRSKYDIVAVKSVMTLMSNWRKAALDLHHDGLIPSHAVTYFDGFWAWDSWKHAVALSLFAPELAKNQIRAMFDYQDSLGMVPDCIYLDKSENNLRDTKPPLAAWAVFETFNNCHDTAFVREMLPKLEAYHVWWYKYRDVNKNGWCEYGSTDGTLEAAAWESGMDNAVRFDSVKMLYAGGIAWSMDQESVDLNGFLVAEKSYLSKLNQIIGNIPERDKYLNDYETQKSKFDSYFFDKAKGYYFDISIANASKIDVDGTEAFIPLWANISSKESAIGVKDIIMNPNKFNTVMPFPTLAADNSKLDVKGYWRGPVWLDQAWFGVMALNNYQFNDEAKELTLKLFNNANGLLNDMPIHENYNPLTGERLKAPHFSWSACHYLLLYRMGYHIK